MKNPFLEQQRQLLEMWAENVEKVPGMEAYAEMYRSMIPEDEKETVKETVSTTSTDPLEYWKNLSKGVPGAEIWMDAFSFPTQPWTQLFSSPAAPAANPWTAMNPVMDQWMKMGQIMTNPTEFWKNMTANVPGMDVYNQLQELWKDFQDPVNIAAKFTDDYMKLSQSVLQGFMPPSVSPYLTQSKDLMDSCIALYQYLFSPWMKIDENIFQRIAAGDSRAYIDFFKKFQDNYEETFNKVFNMMGMGLNRESNEDYMKAIDAYFRALYATGELMALLYNTWEQSAQDLVSAYQTQVMEGKAITTFKDFYDLWFNNTEAAFEDLFDTDEFAKTFGNFSDMYAKYMIATNKVIERMLAPLPIPTKKDMDSLYLTVYELRKEVRNIRKQVEALQKEADDKKAAAAKKGTTKS